MLPILESLSIIPVDAVGAVASVVVIVGNEVLATISGDKPIPVAIDELIGEPAAAPVIGTAV